MTWFEKGKVHQFYFLPGVSNPVKRSVQFFKPCTCLEGVKRCQVPPQNLEEVPERKMIWTIEYQILQLKVYMSLLRKKSVMMTNLIGPSVGALQIFRRSTWPSYIAAAGWKQNFRIPNTYINPKSNIHTRFKKHFFEHIALKNAKWKSKGIILANRYRAALAHFELFPIYDDIAS